MLTSSLVDILAVIKAWSTSFIAAKSLFSVFLGFNPIGIGAGLDVPRDVLSSS